MEMVETNANVINITDSPGVLEMLKKSDATVKQIIQGLDVYLDKKCLAFPRYVTHCTRYVYEYVLFEFVSFSCQVILFVSARDFESAQRNQGPDKGSRVPQALLRRNQFA